MPASRRALLPVLPVVVTAAVAGCFGRGPPINPVVDDAGPPPPSSFGEGGALFDVDLGASFAVTGLQPSHGPFTGGTRSVLTGRGFASNVTVSIGGVTLPASSVLASDPDHISVITPAGAPGPADVKVVNVTTAQTATLPSGFVFDDLAVTPGTGSTTGGTRIALQGSGTAWTSASAVAVGDAPCTSVLFKSATSLSCLTPAGSPGSQDVTVTNADGTVDRASDAFLYSDSPDGFRGGLYGGALAGTLNVLGFDSWTGAPLTGVVIAGSSLATAVTGMFAPNGSAQLESPKLTGKVTVTVAAYCHSPMTYVDVPVDTVTVYLDPTLDPNCDTGDPPSDGSYYDSDEGSVQGALVWYGGVEFQRSPWSNVPKPVGPSQRQAAYVFTSTGSPTDTFSMPDPSTAVTPDTTGTLGYNFTIPVGPGTATLYALAGIEDDSTTPPTFEPYAMGAVRGVAVQPGQMTTGVSIPMSTVLDRTLTTAPMAPAPGLRGPDRLVSSVSVALEIGAYAVLPQGTRTNLLPVGGDVTFVGVPALDDSLATASYQVAASAVTGESGGDPRSVVSALQTTDANDVLSLGGFMPVPTLAQPTTGKWSGTHVTIGASGHVDLAVVQIVSGGGLVTWTIAAPGDDLSFGLPDLSRVPGVDPLVRGMIHVTFSVAQIAGFEYATLRSGQLSTSSWNAYAEDTTVSTY